MADHPSLTVEDLWEALDDVKDPEIPVVSVVEMGIIREVVLEEDGGVRVTMTPTFAGCPALKVMQDDIQTRLIALGFERITVDVTLSPPWTTDWITEPARQKLKDFGLAPPPRHGGDFELVLMDIVHCPYCDSSNTTIKNTWGPTACRAIHYCNSCQQPFEQFKPL